MKAKYLKILYPAFQYHFLPFQKANLCKVTHFDLFGFFSGKFKLPNILGNGILFPRIYKLLLISENASWPLISMTYLPPPPPPAKKGVRVSKV